MFARPQPTPTVKRAMVEGNLIRSLSKLSHPVRSQVALTWPKPPVGLTGRLSWDKVFFVAVVQKRSRARFKLAVSILLFKGRSERCKFVFAAPRIMAVTMGALGG